MSKNRLHYAITHARMAITVMAQFAGKTALQRNMIAALCAQIVLILAQTQLRISSQM
jgi:hypothetical protein